MDAYVERTSNTYVRCANGVRLVQLRASYKIVDHRERFIAPHCMAFNSTSTQYVTVRLQHLLHDL